LVARSNKRTATNAHRPDRRPRQGGLAKLNDIIEGFVTEDQLAIKLRKTVRTLRRWRLTQEGPPWAKYGTTVIYPIDEIGPWLHQQIKWPPRSGKRASA